MNMQRNYWNEYYEAIKRIEAGEGRENRELYRQADKLHKLAQAKSQITRSCMGMLAECTM